MTIKLTNLINLGDLAAQAWDECDTALQQLNEGFGKPFEAAKDNLLNDVKEADREGFDLSVFSGGDSKFKFIEHNANIVVRIYKKPTPHTKLEKLAERVQKLENDLKVAKLKLKHEIEQLTLTGECDKVTDKIVLAFNRIK